MKDRVLVAHMIAYIEEHLTDGMKTTDLADISGYSANRLRQKFFNITGDTPAGYLRKRRLTEAAKEILAGSQGTEVALKYGYSSQDNFITAFRGYFGVTPYEIFRMDARYKKFIGKLREELSIMEITQLKQPPLSATPVSVIKGAADYFDLGLSAPMVYGLTGYGFMVNIHKELCPSGPYVWNRKPFYSLMEGFGIRKCDEIMITKDSSETERKEAEQRIKKALSEGKLCVLDYLESQLCSGYDEEGFLFLQPWNCSSHSELPRLTFGTWSETLEKEGWVCFQILEQREPVLDEAERVKKVLSYAADLYTKPEAYTMEHYGINLRAYANWLGALENGHGESHGHWWNVQVWSESRQMGADFLKEITPLVSDADLCRSLAENYTAQSQLIRRAGEKERSLAEKKVALQESAALDENAAEMVRTLAAEHDRS